MSNLELLKKVEEYTELKRMANELADELATIETAIKNHMGEQEELSINGYKITYTKYESTRFDTTSFKKDNENLYNLYTKKTMNRRFGVKA